MQTSRLRKLPVGICVSLLTLALAGPAHAIRCKDWVRMNPTQRAQSLQAEFHAILTSARASNWATVNKTVTNQCLNRNMPGIAAAFDEQCSKGLRVPVDILDRTLMNYVRSCAKW